MLSEQVVRKVIMAASMVVLALWATVAVAGVNEDFLEAAKGGDLPAVKGFLANGADVNAKSNIGLNAVDMTSDNEIMKLLIRAGGKSSTSVHY